MAGDVAHPWEKKLGPFARGTREIWETYNCGRLRFFLFPPVLDKKESSLSWTPTTAFGEVLRDWQLFLANYFTFSHIFLFGWTHSPRQNERDRLDCQCYCATWFQAFRAAPTESTSGQAHTNTRDWATMGCQRSAGTTMVATRRECWIGQETDGHWKTASCQNITVI